MGSLTPIAAIFAGVAVQAQPAPWPGEQFGMRGGPAPAWYGRALLPVTARKARVHWAARRCADVLQIRQEWVQRPSADLFEAYAQPLSGRADAGAEQLLVNLMQAHAAQFDPSKAREIADFIAAIEDVEWR